MTRQITMSDLEHEKILAMLGEIKELSEPYYSKEDAQQNLDAIHKLVFKLYKYVNVHPDVDR